MLPETSNPKDSVTSFGVWLRHRRQTLHMTRPELAERVGCSVSTLRKLEDDERRPSPSMAENLAQALLVDPVEELRFVEVARGLRSIDHLDALTPAASPQRSLSPPDLPSATTTLIGRSQEIETVLGLLRETTCRLVTLTGPGGIGKTRLALAVADAVRGEFPDGVYFVPLAALTGSDPVEVALAQSLGLSPDERQWRRPQLTAALRDRRLLLMLDNVEHLPEVADLVTVLLAHAPRLAVLVTSRTRLHLSAEWVVELGGLSIPPVEAERLPPAALLRFDAPRLFIEAARRTRLDFVPSPADAQAIAEICRLVEGMPLALELAAPWISTLSCGDIAAEIAQGLDFLATPLRDLPPRHRSLRAVFDHSWRLLSEEEQKVLGRLAVFRAPFTRAAAHAVTGASITQLAGLIAKSLLRRSQEERYDLHELVGQYAGEQLAAVGETVSTITRYVDFYLGLAEEAAPHLRGPQQGAWLARLEDEHNLLRAALQMTLDQQEIEKGLRLVVALARFWGVRAHAVEGYGWITRLLDSAEDLSSARLKASAHLAAGRLAYHVDGTDAAHVWFASSLALFSQEGDRAGEAAALLGLGDTTHDHSIARELYERGLARARAASDLRGAADALYGLASLASGNGDYAEADVLYAQSLEIIRQLGDGLGEAATVRAMAIGAFRQGDFNRAEMLYKAALDLHRSLETAEGVSISLNDLGDVALARGDPRAAAYLYREGLQCAWDAQNRWLVAWGFEGLAHTAAVQGDAERAVRLSGCADALFVALGTRLRPDDRRERERRLASLRSEMGEPSFAICWHEGMTFSQDAAFDYAMETELR